MLLASAAGAVVFIAVSYWIAHPYLYIADNFPAARRSPHEVAAFSGPLKVFLTAPEENFVWGAATAGFRDSVSTWQEKTLFPGAVILVLAVVGLWSSSLPKRWRVGPWDRAAGNPVLELGFREGEDFCGPTASSTTYSPAGTRSARRAASRPSRRSPSPCSRRPGSRRRSARPGVGDGPPGPRSASRACWSGNRHRGPQPAVRPLRQPGAAVRATVRALDG